ncbi:MAG: hypothetical protein F4152_01180 [Dehalococcoidia bacterium]|nr:hypothetical protein [Dehalococcoidia bacterium]
MPERQNPSPGEDVAAQIGRSLGRLVRKAHDAALEAQPEAELHARRAAKIARETIDAARPEAERIAHDAVEAARPAAEQAAKYVREHEDEIRQVGSVAGEAIAWRVLPRPLRPFLAGKVSRFLRQNPPK